MSYTSNIIYLTNVICVLPMCTCTYTYIHHLHTSFHVRYANYFVYKKQSSLPVPGLRPAFLSCLSLGSHVIWPSHFMSLCLCLPFGEQGQPEKEPPGSLSSSRRCRAGRAGMCHSLQNNGNSDIPNAMAI